MFKKKKKCAFSYNPACACPAHINRIFPTAPTLITLTHYTHTLTTSQALTGLLPKAIEDAHHVTAILGQKDSSSSSSSNSNSNSKINSASNSSSSVHDRLAEVWGALCSLQHMLLGRLSADGLEWEGSMLQLAAESMQVCVGGF